MDSSLIQLEYSDHESKQVIIENWIKMLTNREWLNEDLSTNIKTAIKSLNSSDNKEIAIINSKIINPITEKNETNYVLIFILRKISTIVKDQDIQNYINTYKDYYKFFILQTIEQTTVPTIETISSKVEKQLIDVGDTEVFSHNFLMIDRIDNIYVPQHILLSKDESEQYVQEYGSKLNMSKIFITDPISRYYNAKPGQIFKIIRSSNTSGQELSLRYVVSIKMM